MIFQVLFTLLFTFLIKIKKSVNYFSYLIPLLWFFSIFRPFDGVNTHLFFQVISVFLSLIYIIFNRDFFYKSLYLFKPFYCFLFICLVSLFWSRDLNHSIQYCVYYIVFVIFFIKWGFSKDPKTLFSILLKSNLLLIFGGLFSFIFLNSISYNAYDSYTVSQKALSSFFPSVNPNSLTFSAIFLFILLDNFPYKLNNFNRSHLKNILKFIILVIAFLARSRTSILFLIIYFILNKKYIQKYLFVLISFVLALIRFSNDIFIFILRGQSYDRLINLSGRIDAWKIFYYNYFKIKPFFGYGYGTKIQGLEQIISSGISTYDNTFIDVVYYVGLIGLIPFLIFVFSVLKHSYKIKTNSRVLFWLLFLIIFRSFSGPSFHSVHFHTFLLIMTCVLVTYNINTSFDDK